MKEETPIVKINPDIEVMNPEDFEPPELVVVVDDSTGLKYCDHSEIRVYPHHRLIKCRQCHKVIEPFDYIITAGRQAHNFLSHMKYLKIQMDRMVKEEEELRKAVQALKRKVKNGV